METEAQRKRGRRKNSVRHPSSCSSLLLQRNRARLSNFSFFFFSIFETETQADIFQSFFFIFSLKLDQLERERVARERINACFHRSKLYLLVAPSSTSIYWSLDTLSKLLAVTRAYADDDDPLVVGGAPNLKEKNE